MDRSVADPIAFLTALAVGAQPTNIGESVTRMRRKLRSAFKRRRTQRTPDAIGTSGRRLSAAASTLGADSTCTATASTSATVDGSPLARKSGSRLHVPRADGQ